MTFLKNVKKVTLVVILYIVNNSMSILPGSIPSMDHKQKHVTS